MSINQFHVVLGRFLYALSLADGKVDEREEKLLRRLIDEIVGEADEKDFDTKSFILAKMEFIKCKETRVGEKAAAKDFFSYLDKNKIPQMEIELAEKIMKKIAEAYRGINKEESDLLLQGKKALENSSSR